MNVNRIYAYGSTAAVVIAIIVGLTLSGSPAAERQSRLDKQRLGDLHTLSNHIQRFAEEQGSLPITLEALVDGHNVDRIPRDPESQMMYTFAQTGENSYRLCADFTRASLADEVQGFWAHEAGYQCFELSVAAPN